MSKVPSVIMFGIYECNRCQKRYTENDVTFRICTPEYCHDCLEHLQKQVAIIPVPEVLH